MNAEDHAAEAHPTPPRGGVLSRLFFCWAWPTLKLGHDLGSKLTQDDLPALDPRHTPELLTASLLALWDEEISTAEKKGRPPSLFRALWHFYGPVKLIIASSSVVMTLLNIGIPLLSQVLIGVIESDGSITVGILSVVGMVGCVVLSSIAQQHAWFATSTKAVHAWIALTSLIYHKPAHLTRGTLSQFTEGELINLMTVDCQAFLEVGQFLFFFAAMPWQLVISAAILFWLLGWVFVVGLAILAVNVVIVERLGDGIKRAQQAKNKLADERSVMLNESLQGVRTVKLYAWERVVERRVAERRAKELYELRKIAILRAVQQFLSFGVPTITTVPVFYLYNEQFGNLRASIIFTAVAIFEFLNMSLVVLPNLLNEVRRMLVSVQRIGRFLAIRNTYAPAEAMVGDTGRVVISGAGNFTWGSKVSAADAPAAAPAGAPTGGARQRPARVPAGGAMTAGAAATPEEAAPMVLRELDFEAGDGKLVVVCGRVGSGKTSLASAVLGMLQKGAGTTLAVTGRTAYVPQQAFVMNDTVKNNILFGGDMDEDPYARVVTACALDQDLAVLPSGDETEIGERGITISGGQRQRIAIARAAYSGADLIVLDDPLSAMDPHVGQKVFDACIAGILGSKTRVFCTNQLQFASHADYIYYLDGGRIVERGSFRELARKPGGAFAELYAHVSSGGKDDAQAAADDAADAAAAATAREEEELPPPAAGAALAAAPAGTEDAQPPAPAVVDAKEAKAKLEAARAGGKLVQTEARSLGRVGIRTFIPLARAAQASGLGVVVLVFIILMPATQYLTNILLSRWTDQVSAGREDTSLAVQLYIASAVVFAIVVLVRGAACSLFFTRASEHMHARMLRSVLLQPMRFFDTTPVGRVLNRFGGDFMMLDVMLPRLFDIWAFIVGSNVTTIILSMVFAPPMVVVNVILIVLFRYLYNYYSAVALELQRLILISVSPIVASFSSFLIGLESIRAFNRVGTFQGVFQKRQLNFAKTFTALVSIERFTMMSAVCVGVSLFLLSLSLVLLFLSRARVWVTPGSAGVTLAYASIISFRLPAMFLMSVTLERLLAAGQRVIEYVDMPPETNADGPATAAAGTALAPMGRGGKVAAPAATRQRSASHGAEGVPDTWPARGTLSLRNVSLRYAPDAPLVLDGVSLEVAHGDRVGIVGRTGAGKSSILLAVFRMAPTTGVIEIGGLDVAAEDTPVPRRLVRARLGMIPQDSYLFSGTIRSNLDVEGTYSDEALARALKLAHLDGMVAQLEGGLDAEVKEKGDNFSAGQVQLLCLARVLLKDPTIVFMDEATASVDLKTDALVQQTIREALSECTIVTIAHRLATIIDFDKIAVLDAGKVAEFGPPHELLRKGADGALSRLVDSTGAASARDLRERAAAAYAVDRATRDGRSRGAAGEPRGS